MCSGHRIGTAEIEDVVNSHIAIAESAVVGYEHTLYGEGIYAFMVLKKTVQEDSDQIIGEIKNLVKKNIASYAVPHRLLVKFLNDYFFLVLLKSCFINF